MSSSFPVERNQKHRPAKSVILKITNLLIPAVETCEISFKVLASAPCVLPFLMIKEQAKAA